MHGDGTWVVVDVSLDNLRPTFVSRSRRRPSGCLIQELPNGYSKVTWIEHVGVDDKSFHGIYKALVNSGLAFGAIRWVAILDRQCERLASVMANNISTGDVGVGPFSTSFPKYTSSAAQRNLKNFSQFTGKVTELETYVQTNKDKFETDKNLGLVKQVLASMYKRNIQRLTQTYLTLSLQDIATIVQLNSPKVAEMHVLQMIQEGEIYATINQKDGMVRFLEDPEQYKTCGMIEHVDCSIQSNYDALEEANDNE
ncbi:hypothetical protein OROGR_011767 [Orobanche gracilis]